MNRIIARLALVGSVIVTLSSCNHNGDHPDVSKVSVPDVHIMRFDTAFFSLDTGNINASLFFLNQRFPYFTQDFVANILGAGPLSDTSRVAFEAARQFMISYLPIRDSLEKKYANLDWLEKQLHESFQYIKYYFPKYQLPPKVVSFIGPFDGPGVAVTSYTLAIGLQSYAGRNFSFYLTGKGQDLYPQYISRRFEPEYINANCVMALETDIIPDNSEGRPLVEQMVNKGRYWWLAGKLLPDAPDSIRTGFTKAQLDWCAGNESSIWGYFLKNTDLYTVDPDIIKNYIGEGPKTLGMPDNAPGNIGTWVGWRIVNKYAEDHPGLTPEQLMQVPARQLFEESKYKPK